LAASLKMVFCPPLSLLQADLLERNGSGAYGCPVREQ
jgi:hypothetical protein